MTVWIRAAARAAARPVARLVAGLALSGLAAVAWGNPPGPPYPRLANVYLHGAVDPAAIAPLARWDVLVLDSAWSDAQLARLRDRNPDLKIFFYVCGHCVAVPPAAGDAWRRENYNYAQAYDMWWRNADGSIASDWPQTQLLNMTDYCPDGPAGPWRRYMPMRIEQLVNSHRQLDGVFLDNFWKSISWEQGGAIRVDSDCAVQRRPQGCDRTPDAAAVLDARWNHGLTEFASELRRRLDRVEANRGDRPLAIVSNGSGDYFTWLNGTMYEHFPLGAAAPDPGNAYGYNWMSSMFAQPSGYLAAPFRSAPYNVSILNAGWQGTWAAPQRTPEFERHKRFTLVSALLGDGYYSLDAASAGHGSLWWEPEYDHAGRGKGYLGYPKGPAYRVVSSPTTDQIVNGSFSIIDAGWTAQGAQASGTYGRDWTVWHSGPGSARLQATNVQVGGSFKLWQNVEVLGGNSYALSFWAKAASPLSINTHLYGDACPGNRCLADQEIVLGTEWRYFEVPFTASGNSQAGLNFILNQTGTVWIDDVSLRQGAFPIYRRDFERGTVLLNYTNQTRTVNLGRTYNRLSIPGSTVFDGAAVRTETVPPSDARILVDALLPAASPLPPEPQGSLWPNEPNPFHGGTEIRFALRAAAAVQLQVYDIAGRRVRTLIDAPHAAGPDLRVTWDGTDDHGQRVPPGIYVARLRTPSFTSNRKMTVLP